MEIEQNVKNAIISLVIYLRDKGYYTQEDTKTITAMIDKRFKKQVKL